MALGMYSRAFLVPSSRLGLWFEENSSIHVFCFDPEALNPFSTSAIPDDFKRDRSHFFCLGPPLAKMTIPCDLAEGVHEFQFPPEFVRVDELFAIASNPHAGPRDAFCSILEIRPSENLVRVYPQKWFTSDTLDVGYQWITRAARDPRTGRLVGDGIRIDPFELSEDGCHR